MASFSQENEEGDTVKIKTESEEWIEYDDTKILLRHERSFGLNIHTNGWGLGYRMGFHKTGYKKRMLEFELVNMKHPKEVKSINPYVENAKGFVFGKQYSVLMSRIGYGIQKVIYSKSDKNGIEIRYNGYLGASISLAKPVYLNILYVDDLGRINIVSEKYDPNEHDVVDIVGKAPFFMGLGESKIYPGIYGKFSLNFEYGDNDKKIRSLETGIVVDGYIKEIPIMAFTDNTNIFVNLYLAYYFGKRW
jgi:hypothetical protein